METTKSWFTRQEEAFKKKAEEDFAEWKKKDDELWDAYLERLRNPGSVKTGDGILPMIEKVNDFPRLPENPTLEDIKKHLGHE